jgi:hypothetical protein
MEGNLSRLYDLLAIRTELRCRLRLLITFSVLLLPTTIYLL